MDVECHLGPLRRENVARPSKRVQGWGSVLTLVTMRSGLQKFPDGGWPTDAIRVATLNSEDLLRQSGKAGGL